MNNKLPENIKKSSHISDWHPSSWKNFNDLIASSYPNQEELDKVTLELSEFPSLINMKSVLALREELANMEGNFLLQIGDCAEDFSELNSKLLDKFLHDIQNLESLLQGKFKKVTKILRFAGQFAKPRSSFFASPNILNYFGDIINEVSPKNRDFDPNRMIKAYFISAAKLNYLHSNNFQGFISHEALLLPYEQAMTRNIAGKYYNLGAHLLWVGYRNAKINSSNIEYLRNIINPIGIKVGPNTDISELKQILNIINPNFEKGKIIIIFRFGFNKQESMQYFMEELSRFDKNIIFQCDPMHGNNQQSGEKKFRITKEIEQDFSNYLSLSKNVTNFTDAIHLEFSSQDIYECINDEAELNIQNYKSLCDPRLNYIQVKNLFSKTLL